MPELETEAPLEARFGTARHPLRPVVHPRPAGLDGASVKALGQLSAALEVVEQARGHLYAFHRLSGTADRELQEALRSLRAAGHDALADDIDHTLVGRDVAFGAWTFELVEEYDSGYWTVFRAAHSRARTSLGGAEPHVYEAEMKHREQGR